jgi:hypothetical protein
MDRSDYLSKTLFLKGLQCPKYLYLSKYHPELMDETSAERGMRFEAGREVGVYARRLFPGGVEIPYEGQPLSEQVRQTRCEIETGATTLYEATFSHEGLLVKVDILQKGRNGWEIHEVKGSTKVEDRHLSDLAFQYHVVQGAGLPLARAGLAHINNEYVRMGEIDVEQLFKTRDFTQEVRDRQPFIIEEIDGQREALRGPMPEIDIGRHCEDSYGCDFSGHCWAEVPEDSVLYLRGRGADKYTLYAQGYRRFADLPLDVLSFHQRMQVEGALYQKDSISPKKVREFLRSLSYPLCFLDFETFDVAIPPFDGTRPYQKIPFQYSLHCLEREGGEPKHHEFLALPGTDPREEIARRLVSQIADGACIVVYNRAFEKQVLESMSVCFPQFAPQIEVMIENLKDLMVPFKNKDIYLPAMEGSYSMKGVLPALVPGMGYEDMEVADGQMATVAYHAMNMSRDPIEVERLRTALLEYCRLDTLGMMKIVERMGDYTCI